MKRTILTEAQQAAINHEEGPCRVLAGPGSGKTMVLTRRYARLVQQHGADPRRILAITFTKKAGEEMKHRIEAAMRTRMRRDEHWIGTMHASFRSILSEEWGTKAKLLDGRPKNAVIHEIRKEGNLTYLNELKPKDIFSLIDRWRMEMLSPEEAHQLVVAQLRDQELGHIADLPIRPMPYQVPEGIETSAMAYRQVAAAFHLYQRLKQNRGWVDFEDMIYETWRLLSGNDRVLRKWQGRWDHVMVDEFQDIDPCQYAVVKLLVAEHQNIYVVGDDDQSIYDFRGARPEIFVRFDKEFDGVTTVKLDRNFRCPNEVVQIASRMIRRNKNRLSKEFTGEDREASILFTRPAGRDEEADNVVAMVAHLRGLECPLNEIVVTYRTNAESLPFETALMAAEIPYLVRNGGCFYDLKEVAPLIEYIRIAVGQGDTTSIEAVANKPNRFIPKTAITKWRRESGDLNGLLRVDLESPMHARAMRELHSALISIRQLGRDRHVKTPELLMSIMQVTNYKEWAMRERGLTGDVDSDLAGTFTQLARAAEKNPDPVAFLRVVEQTREFARRRNRSDDAVLLSTFHGVKGLEFECVFLTGMCEGTMPHEKAVANGKVGEERRLAHVGWTRTKRIVQVSSPVSEGIPSRFVLEWQGVSDEEIAEALKGRTSSPGEQWSETEILPPPVSRS